MSQIDNTWDRRPQNGAVCGLLATALAAVLLTAVLLEPRVARAGDWPQILGPDRDGKAKDEHLLKTFPAAGPKTLWQRPVGNGFAGVSVVGKRAVLAHRLGNELVIECLEAQTGKPIWKKAFPTNYVSQISSDNGPRCMPLVHQGQIYLVGAEGDLHCLELESGKERWSRKAYADYRAPEGYFGAGASPIVDSGKLLWNVGGRGAGLVAFDLNSGKTLWQATDDAASYSSPVATTLDGKRHVIFITRLNVVSVDPQNGAERFRFPFGMRGPTVNAAMPLVIDRHLFVSASYGIGAQWVDLQGGKPKTVWENDDTMSSQYTTCVEKDGMLYGVDGRQDGPAARLRCFNPRTAEVLWTENSFGTANLILADDTLLIVKTDGHLVLAEASPRKYRELASAKVLDTIVQALPALSGGLLYVRDTDTLKCLDLRAEATPGSQSKAR